MTKAVTRAEKREKFIVGFLATILLGTVAAMICAAEWWLMVHLGPIPCLVGVVLMVAIFAGFMNASEAEKETHHNGNED